MAPILYYTDSSPFVRSVLLTAKAIGLNLELKHVDINIGEQLKPEFLKLNPQHTVPVIVEEDGFTLSESFAIITYLVGKYGKDDSLYPTDLRKRAIIDHRLHYANGTLGPRLARPVKIIFSGLRKKLIKEEIDDIKEAYGFLEVYLKEKNYVAGNELTVADFSLITIIMTTNVFVPTNFPRINAWIKRMKALPYFEEVNGKGEKKLEQLVKFKLGFLG